MESLLTRRFSATAQQHDQISSVALACYGAWHPANSWFKLLTAQLQAQHIDSNSSYKLCIHTAVLVLNLQDPVL